MKTTVLKRTFPIKLVIVAVWFTLLFLLEWSANAQTRYTVNTLTDANPAGAGVGSGTTGDLRYTISQSNANPSAIASEPNEIVFSVDGQVNLAGALPLITAAVAIQGHENGNTINRSTGGNYRLLHIDVNAQLVYLSHLTFQNGIADFGGAIRNEGAFLDIYNCKFLNNQATNGGGAILNTAPNSLEMGFTLFQGNTATGQGGAILSDGYNAWFNNAFLGNRAEQGGAVFIGNFGQGEISNTTFSGNQANQNGSAGIKQGGAIYNDGAVRLLNCTVTLNTASAGQGGGIYNSPMSFDLSLQNNIIAENSTGGDLKNEGFVSENTKNLVMDCNSCGITWFSTADPALLPLQDNGGFAPTHALDPGSPAINQGAKPAPIDDQRGFVRVGMPDLGAYEFAAPLNGGRGTALNLDGSSQYAHTFTPLMANRDDNFSMEVWVKLLDTPTNNAVVVYNGIKGTNGYGIIINNARQAVFQINNEIVGTFGEVALNKWTHLAITKLDADYKGFINGFATTFTLIREPNFPTSGVYIGGTPNGEFFKGQIDEVRVWSSFKTQDDFRTSMHTTSWGNEADLQHYYQFNQGAVNEDFVGGRKLILINNIPNIPSDAPVDLISKVDVISHAVLDPNSTNQSAGGLEIKWGAVIPNGQVMVNYVQDAPSNSPGLAFGGGYWIINNFGTNQTFSPITLKFRFPDEVDLDENPANYELYKRPTNETGAWTLIKHGLDGITVTVSNALGDKYIQFAANATNTQLISFSQFVIVENSGPLGVRWLRYDAKRISTDEVELNWQTASEIDNSGFHIQISENGLHFENAGWVDGRGTVNAISAYQFVHRSSKPLYYRLEQVDRDGKKSYSAIKFVDGIFGFAIYPNPTTDKVQIQLKGQDKADKLDVEIRDLKGNVVFTQVEVLEKVNASLEAITPQLSTGTYLIQIRVKSSYFVRKFIKL